MGQGRTLESADVEPERELWAAVIKQAVREAGGMMADANLKDRAPYTHCERMREARVWLAGSELEWICSQLGLHPGEIRKGARDYQARRRRVKNP